MSSFLANESVTYNHLTVDLRKQLFNTDSDIPLLKEPDLTQQIMEIAVCVVATDSNITLSGEQTIQSVDVYVNNFVCVNGQDDKTENGVYLCKDSNWERWSDGRVGHLAKILGGTYANRIFHNINNELIYGETEIEFELLPSNISELFDVSLSSLITNDILKFDGTSWVNTPLPTGVENLSELNDVDLGTLTSGQLLAWDGSKWVNITFSGMPSGTVLGSILANNASNEFVETDKLIIDIANSLIKAYYPIITVPLYPNNIKLGNAETLQSLAAGATLNIGIGEKAGQLISTGNGNILLGYKSGNKITTGSLNVILGYSFGGTELVTGDDNVFIGNTAGVTSKGSYNIYMGTYSGGGAMSTAIGNSNIGIGRYALQRNVASTNIAIGSEAFRNRTTGYRGVAIGNYAGNNDNDNYKLHIGGIDGKSLIEGDFANDWVKIKDWLYVLGLTPSTLIMTDSDKKLVSISNSSGYLKNDGSGGLSWDTLGSGGVENLSELNDVDLGTLTSGQLLAWDGSKWVNITFSGMPSGTVLGSILANNASNEFVETDKLIIDIANSKILAKFHIITMPDKPTNVRIGDITTLQALTSGTYNTAIGVESLKSLTTANYNTAIGWLALEKTTSGSNNVAIGAGALQYLTTGGFNCAIGTNALRNVIGGTYNFAFGDVCMYNITSGSYNTAIGRYAFFKRKTGHRGVAIGQNAGYNDNANDKLHIANTDTKSLIEGDFANDWIKIKDWLYVLGLTENTLVRTDSDKKLVSVANSSGYLKNDGSGGLTWDTLGSGGVDELSELTDVELTSLATDDVLVWNGSKWVNITAPTSEDIYTKVSSVDTTSGYLNDKIDVVNITKEIINPGANEVLRLTGKSDINELTDTSNLLFDGDYNSLANLPTLQTNRHSFLAFNHMFTNENWELPTTEPTTSYETVGGTGFKTVGGTGFKVTLKANKRYKIDITLYFPDDEGSLVWNGQLKVVGGYGWMSQLFAHLNSSNQVKRLTDIYTGTSNFAKVIPTELGTEIGLFYENDSGPGYIGTLQIRGHIDTFTDDVLTLEFRNVTRTGMTGTIGAVIRRGSYISAIEKKIN